MSLVGHLDLGRSHRVAIDRTGTLRDRSRAPIDVVIDNLSTTGCLFVLDRDLPLGALVSIGIPGIGVRHARISRDDRPHYACAFIAPVSPGQVTAALSAETLVLGIFPRTSPPLVARPRIAAPEADPAVRTWSLRRRGAAIVGASLLLWAPIVAGIFAIVR